jgi:hypothetical protein
MNTKKQEEPVETSQEQPAKKQTLYSMMMKN